MDTALPQKFPFILDRNLAKANSTEDCVCTSCDKVVLGLKNCLHLIAVGQKSRKSSPTSTHLLYMSSKLLSDLLLKETAFWGKFCNLFGEN